MRTLRKKWKLFLAEKSDRFDMTTRVIRKQFSNFRNKQWTLKTPHYDTERIQDSFRVYKLSW
jgi:hypothetical protein